MLIFFLHFILHSYYSDFDIYINKKITTLTTKNGDILMPSPENFAVIDNFNLKIFQFNIDVLISRDLLAVFYILNSLNFVASIGYFM